MKSPQELPSTPWMEDQLSRSKEHLVSLGITGLAGMDLPLTVLADSFSRFLALLLSWGSSMDLVAPAPAAEQFLRHFVDSFAGSLLIGRAFAADSQAGKAIVDVGSGAGFPGLVMALLHPTRQIVLIESREKRCLFLAEVRRKLGLPNVEIQNGRFEQLSPGFQHPVGLVISRALGGYPHFINTAAELLLRSGGGEICALVGPNFAAPPGSVAAVHPVEILPYRALPEGPPRALATWRIAAG